MFSCSSQEIKNHNSTNTQIYINGAIYTVNESQTWAEAMIVEDGIIRYVGSTIEAQKHIIGSFPGPRNLGSAESKKRSKVGEVWTFHLYKWL